MGWLPVGDLHAASVLDLVREAHCPAQRCEELQREERQPLEVEEMEEGVEIVREDMPARKTVRA